MIRPTVVRMCHPHSSSGRYSARSCSATRQLVGELGLLRGAEHVRTRGVARGVDLGQRLAIRTVGQVVGAQDHVRAAASVSAVERRRNRRRQHTDVFDGRDLRARRFVVGLCVWGRNQLERKSTAATGCSPWLLPTTSSRARPARRGPRCSHAPAAADAQTPCYPRAQSVYSRKRRMR